MDSKIDRETCDGISITIKDGADSEKIKQTVLGWVEDVVSNSLPSEPKVIKELKGLRSEFASSVQEIMDSGELKEVGQGLVVYGAKLTAIFNALKRLFDALSREEKAETLLFPTVMPLKVIQKCDYLSSFPQILSFITHFKEDYSVIDQYVNECGDKTEISECQPKSGSLQSYKNVMQPAVCYHLYNYLKDKTLPGDMYIANAMGDCFRYESKNLNSLDRLFNFRMYEIIGVGAEQKLLEWRKKMIEKVSKIFTGLGLPARIEVANDPFFIKQSVIKSTFQIAYDLKYELLCPFPNKDNRLAVASFNFHRDFFGTRFNIKCSDGNVANSSCTAFGMDRILATLLVFYGTDLEKWPDSVVNFLALEK